MSGILGTSLSSDNRWVKNLYYGKPGSGKTTNIASMANLGQMVAVDLEGGWDADALRLRDINVDNIHVFRPRNYDEMEQVYWEIKGMIDGGIPLVGCGLDHWSEAQDILVREAAIRRIDKKKRQLEPRLKTSEEAREEYAELSAFRTELPDYGEWTEMGKRLLRLYRDLPMHVAMASHEDSDDSAKIVPMQTEKFRNKLMGGMRTVIYTKVTPIKGTDKVEYTGVTKPVDRFLCKDNTGKLPTVLVNPTMERIIGLMDGTLDITSDPAQLAYAERKKAQVKK